MSIKEKVMAPSNVVELTDANFAAEVEQHRGVCFMLIWEDWCDPCNVAFRMMPDLATDYAGKVKVCTIDTQKHRNTRDRFGVTNIPTMIIFKDGEPVMRFVSVTPMAYLESALDRTLAGE